MGVSGNSIGDEGAPCIVEALQENNQMQQLIQKVHVSSKATLSSDANPVPQRNLFPATQLEETSLCSMKCDLWIRLRVSVAMSMHVTAMNLECCSCHATRTSSTLMLPC